MRKITLLFFVMVCGLGFSQTFMDSGGPYDLQNGTGITDATCDTADELNLPLTVSGVGVLGTTNTIESITINVTHTWNSDVKLSLQSPDGTITVLLVENIGSSGDDFVDCVLQDGEAALPTGWTSPVTGTFSPLEPLSGFNGTDADGDWVLIACDDADGDVGTIDDWSLTFAQIPTCQEPSDLDVTNIMPYSADLSWTENGSASLYNVEVVLAGETPTGTPTDTGVAIGFTKSGLTDGTSYDFYVQADCTGGDVSTWEGPYTFSTECLIVSSFPWTEDFEGTTEPDLPACWSEINNNADGDSFETYDAYGVSGSQSVGLYTDFNYGANDDYLVLPQFSLTGNERLKYSVSVESSAEPNDYKVMLSTTGNSPSDFTQELLGLTEVSNTTHEEQILYLDSYVGDVYIAIHVPSGGLDGWVIYFDNFTVETLPSCVEPSDLAVDDISATSADLSWTENGTASLYNVEVVLADETPTGTPTDTGVLNGFTKSGLTESTDYEFYVQADCTGGETSVWVGPFAFSTPCNPYTESFTEGFESTAIGSSTNPSIPNCWSYIDEGYGYGYVNDNDSNTGDQNFYFNDGYWYLYSEFYLISPETIDLNSSEGYQLRFFAKGSGDLSVGTMSDPSDASTYTELESINITSTYTEYTVFLPQSTTDDYFSFLMSGSGYGYSVYIDDVVYEPAPSCIPVTDLTASNITAFSADLGWTENGAASQYNVEVVLAGNMPTGTPTDTGVANGFTKGGLSAATNYEFYVQGDCTGGDLSSWVGPYDFTTLCDGGTDIPYAINFDSSSDLPECTSVINEGTGNEWELRTTTVGDFTTNHLRYPWDGSNAANTWFFTGGVNLMAGIEYEISYKYASSAQTTYEEDMKVAYGTLPNSTEMTNVLADHQDILTGNSNSISNTVSFTPSSTGVYYFGFHCYSGADRAFLYLDDILIESEALSNDDFINESAFTYYPNPVKNTLTLNAQNNIDNVVMYNMLGQEVLRATPNTIDSELDMSQLNSGTYFVQVTIANTTKTVRVIKQ